MVYHERFGIARHLRFILCRASHLFFPEIYGGRGHASAHMKTLRNRPVPPAVERARVAESTLTRSYFCATCFSIPMKVEGGVHPGGNPST